MSTEPVGGWTAAELDFYVKNGQLYRDFAVEAFKIRCTGRRRYSARTIAEVLRHNAATRGADPTYKINNNVVPIMARMFMRIHSCPGFFEVRERGEKDARND